jgi:hypothetical protein
MSRRRGAGWSGANLLQQADQHPADLHDVIVALVKLGARYE